MSLEAWKIARTAKRLLKSAFHLSHWNVVRALLFLLLLAGAALHNRSVQTSWVSCFAVELILLFFSVYCLVVFAEYTDRTGYDAADVELYVNPILEAERVLEWRTFSSCCISECT